MFLKHFQVSSFIVEWVNIIAHGEEIDAAIKQALEIDQKCYAGFDNVHTKKSTEKPVLVRTKCRPLVEPKHQRQCESLV